MVVDIDCIATDHMRFRWAILIDQLYTTLSYECFNVFGKLELLSGHDDLF